jgi:hypothetical protein
MEAPLCRLCGHRHWGTCKNIGAAKSRDRQEKLRPPSRLSPPQIAWLTKHQERSEEWLRARLADGFEIHHLDGNHANDEPGNLLLIESVDHKSLHGRRVQHIVRSSTAKFDRVAYQRELMRKRRAAKRELS